MYCIQVSALRKPDMEEQMMKLQPVLEKLRSLDPKTFGLLNNMMDQVQPTRATHSILTVLKAGETVCQAL